MTGLLSDAEITPPSPIVRNPDLPKLVSLISKPGAGRITVAMHASATARMFPFSRVFFSGQFNFIFSHLLSVFSLWLKRVPVRALGIRYVTLLIVTSN